MSYLEKDFVTSTFNDLLEAIEEKDSDKIKGLCKKKVEYPNQVSSVIRTDKTFSVDSLLSVSQVSKGQSPLELHSGFSRFLLTLIDTKRNVPKKPEEKEKLKKYVTANINPNEIDLIKEKTDLAITRMFEVKNNWIETQKLSPAYTVMMTSKSIADKSPAQLLLESPSNLEKLKSARTWLESNVARYKNNQIQIDAIDEAIKLFEKKELKPLSSPSTIVDIYQSGMKIPNSSKLYPEFNNKTFIYKCSIKCQLDKNYPFVINIMNCYAPVKKTSAGIAAEMSSVEGKDEISILLTEQEWYGTISKMMRVRDYFELDESKTMFNVVNELSYFKKKN